VLTTKVGWGELLVGRVVAPPHTRGSDGKFSIVWGAEEFSEIRGSDLNFEREKPRAS
jgi:hypothetical protein